jgi:hypothetical protein
MATLMVLVAPAFNNMKGANDVTSAAYTIKGVLEQARTYAMANNTYTWIGFYEEDGSQPSTSPTPMPGTGRLVMSIVASKDGTQLFDPNGTGSQIDSTKLIQVGKLTKIDNVHPPLFNPVGDGTGDTFDKRPALQNDPVVGYNDSRFGDLNLSPTAPTTNTQFPFQYPVGSPAPTAQYTFSKTLQFNPRGECRINSTYDVRRVIEIGLLQTRGNIIPSPSPAAGSYPGNVVAVQITGFGSNVKIYRR